MTNSLLPSNATAQEKALEGATARLGAVPVQIRSIWNPQSCPVQLLPWLAWALSVDTWDSRWTEATKREVIARSIAVHRRKGTVWSVQEAIRAAGFETPVVLEGLHRQTYDGAINHDGRFYYGWPLAWALYRILLNRPIRNDQALTVRKILATTAPVRSHLLSLDFQEVSNLYDGRALFDGAYNYGVA